MVGKIENIKVRGIVTALPTEIEDDSRYIDVLGEQRVKKQRRITGVKERRMDDGKHTAADYCISAAKQLLRQLEWDLAQIKVMVFVTQHPSLIMPSTAFVIQNHLGLPKDCMVFDVNLGCSGFVSGLHIVASLLQQYGVGSRGLLLAGDIQRNPNYILPNTEDGIADAMLFGSCGTATALEFTKNADSIYSEEIADGSRYKTIHMCYGEASQMNGEEVFEYGITDVVNWVNAFQKTVDGFEKKEIDYYIFHQAQKFLLQNIASICGIDMNQMLMSLEKYGNTSSGSIPLTMCLHKEKLLQKRKTSLFLCGFGIGLSCALMRMSIQSDTVLELIESDEKYSY
ncbi:MAG: hypothetical protein HFG34_06135 [Eubacterium sp.]|nr:hypothetical protein [Eubacterium sp.]